MKKLKKERKTEILHKIKLPLFKSFLFDGYVNSFFSIQTKFCFYENHHQIRKGVMRQLFNYPLNRIISIYFAAVNYWDTYHHRKRYM